MVRFVNLTQLLPKLVAPKPIPTFSVPQIEYPLGDSNKTCSAVYFLLHVFWVILLFCQIVLLFDINVVLMLPWRPDVTRVQLHVTMVVP